MMLCYCSESAMHLSSRLDMSTGRNLSPSPDSSPGVRLGPDLSPDLGRSPDQSLGPDLSLGASPGQITRI